MAPGAGRLPPASELDVAGPVSAYVRGLPTRSRRLIRLALFLFDLLPFPWRFSRRSLAARQEFLREMDSSNYAWAQDLLLLVKVLVGLGYGTQERVRDALGYEMTCAVAPGAPQPPAPEAASPLGDLTPAPDGEECDVAIVGSGAGGAVAAAILAEAGLDVIVLEAGSYMDRRTYPPDPLQALEALYRDNGLTVAQGRPAIPVPVGRAVGGTTVINSGTCFRAPERVLRAWREERGIDWATRLDAEYAEAEEMLNVAPVDVEEMGRNGQLVMEGAAALGASGGPISRNAGRCVTCSSCPAGCRLDAKRAMHVSYLPRAVAAGARVRAGVEARRLIRDGDRVRGVSCEVVRSPLGPGDPAERRAEPPSRRPLEVRARAVVLAGGAIGTPELLLRSGIKGESGLVGHNLRMHPAAWIGGLFEEEVRGWDGVMQSYYVDEWQEMGLLMEATFTPLAFGAQWLPGTGSDHGRRVLGWDRLGSNGVHLSDSSAGRVTIAGDGSARITYRLNREDARRLVFGIARAAEIFFAAGAREVYSQVREMPILERGRVAEFEASDPAPNDLRLEAFHPMGTAAISPDPRTGVTAPDGSVHGIERLYVADASLLPTSLGVNPMMTVIAVSAHLARRLTAELS
jgi:choline dehydrogenase-like flavoprotein